MGSFGRLHRRQPVRPHLHGVLRLPGEENPARTSTAPSSTAATARPRPASSATTAWATPTPPMPPAASTARSDAAATTSSTRSPVRSANSTRSARPGESCFGCQCLTGSLLGQLAFSVAPGPSTTAPPDDGESSWLRVTPTIGINNGTQGDFNPGPLLLEAGFPDANGRTPLYLTATAYIGATVPAIAGPGRACLRIEQDPAHAGEIDCDGGTNYDVNLVVNSGGMGANGTPTLAIGGGATDSGPRRRGHPRPRHRGADARRSHAVRRCRATSPAPIVETAFTTAVATSTIVRPIARAADRPSWRSPGSPSTAMPGARTVPPASRRPTSTSTSRCGRRHARHRAGVLSPGMIDADSPVIPGTAASFGRWARHVAVSATIHSRKARTVGTSRSSGRVTR